MTYGSKLKYALPRKYHTQFFLRNIGDETGVNLDITHRLSLIHI